MNKVDREILKYRLKEKIKNFFISLPGSPVFLVVCGVLLLFLFTWGFAAAMGLLIVPNSQHAPLPLPATTPALNPPAISNLHVDSVSYDAAVVLWETDIPSSGQVEYWESSTEEKFTAGDDRPVLGHRIELYALQPATEYALLVQSVSPAGYSVRSDQPLVFTTRPLTVAPGELAVSVGPEIGQVAPGFSLEEIQSGENIVLEMQRGHWVLLTFWDTSCPACRAQLSQLQMYYDLKPDDLAMLTVNVKEGTDVLLISLLQSRGIEYPVLMDRDGHVAVQYAIKIYPTTFIIDPGGIVRAVSLERFESVSQIAQFLEMVRAGQ